MRRVVVIGASLAGVTAADTLRMEGYEGEITVLGDEPHHPYNRPPLSKAVLAGADPFDRVALPPLGDDVVLWLGQRATGLDLERRRVNLASGDSVEYDGLVIACGARARTLATTNQSGECTLRTLDDALALRGRLSRAQKVIVLGGGFLGMEIASTVRQLGLDVLLIDREPPLRRLVGDYLASVLTAAARDAGVRFEITAGNAALVGEGDVRGVRVADGRTFNADLVITAAGDVPNTEWLIGSGLNGGGPILTDERCRVRPGIVAAGDVSAPGGTRTPHWANAVAQGRTAAAALLHDAAAPPLTTDDYFWTEQFGIELKICGRPSANDSPPTVLDGSVADRDAVLQWSATGDSGGAAATINRRMPISKLRKLATSHASRRPATH